MGKRQAAAARIETVADRKRARRAAQGPALVKTAKTEIDLTQPNARKALTALYPKPVVDTMIDATPETERAALAYFDRRDDESRAKEQKEIAGNVLCNAIGGASGVRGPGWEATWDMANGSVDWAMLVKEQGIADEIVAKYRKPSHRVLNVREKADEG